MSIFKRVRPESISSEKLTDADRLALYEQYSSMAYGVILCIIPEPELAQTVLIDLFGSSLAKSPTGEPTAGEIIRLARAKALTVRHASISTTQDSTPLAANDTMNLATIVFNLAFCQGYSREAIAEKLNLSPANVLKALHAYFKELRSS